MRGKSGDVDTDIGPAQAAPVNAAAFNGQTARDAATSASSPTVTGGKANSPSGIATLGSEISPSKSRGLADLAAAPAAPAAPATFSGPAAVEGLTREQRDAIADAQIAAHNAAIDAAQKEAADKAADIAAAIGRVNAREAQAVTMAGLFDSMPASNAPASDAPLGGGYSPGTEGSVSRDSNTAEGEANGGMIGHYAQGGLGSLGGYSDGGRLLRGPGDGVSDSIPATVGNRQPARLADGEFVVPARIVSELGNGSTEAGARALYKMMDRIQANRRKTTGKNRVAVNSKSHKYLPA
jgi:hypothetical protein